MTGDDTFIKLYRGLLDSAVFADANLLKVWTWCLLKATWKTQHVPVRVGRGETIVTLLPGQFIYGRKVAAKELDMPGTSVDRRMATLEKMGNCVRQAGTHFSVITIVKWDTYQNTEPTSGQASGQATGNQRAGNGQATGTYKKVKKVKKVKNHHPQTPSAEAGRLRDEFAARGLDATAVVVALQEINGHTNNGTADRVADGMLALIDEVTKADGPDAAAAAMQEITRILRDGQRPKNDAAFVSWCRPVVTAAVKAWRKQRAEAEADEARRKLQAERQEATEAGNGRGPLFGEDRIRRVLGGAPDDESEEARAERLRQQVEQMSSEG